MREILFRGKRIDNGEWVKGEYVERTDGKRYILTWTSGDNKNMEIANTVATTHEVIPETVGQFTGLVDKNGKKIFEGDIVKGRWKSNKAIQIFLVRYKNGCFAFDNNCISGTYEDVYDLQVIGNSYDNPKSIGGFEE